MPNNGYGDSSVIGIYQDNENVYPLAVAGGQLKVGNAANHQQYSFGAGTGVKYGVTAFTLSEGGHEATVLYSQTGLSRAGVVSLINGFFSGSAKVTVSTVQSEIRLTSANSPVTKASLMTLLGFVGTEKMHELNLLFVQDDGTNYATFKRGVGTAYAYPAPLGTENHKGRVMADYIEECNTFTLTIPVGAEVHAYTVVGITGIVASAI